MQRAKLVLLLVVTVLLPAGCTGVVPAVDHDAALRAPGADSGAKIRLTLADSWTTTSTAAVDTVHRELIDQFQKDNPDIEIAEDILDNASLKLKIKTLAAANVLPDVFMMLGSDARMFLENHLILPVDEILAKDPEWKKGFRPEAFDDFTINELTAGVPMQMTITSVVYYNADIFRRAGYDNFPETWEAFVDAIPRIRSLGITPISMGNKDQWVAGSCLLSMLGDRFTGTDWFLDILEDKGAKFTDRPFVDALRAVKRLSDMDAFNADINNLDNVQQREAYYSGKAAMFLEGGWAVSSVMGDAPQAILDETRLAVLPAVPGGKGAANAAAGGSGWALAFNANLHGEKLDAAVKLVKWLTGETAANRLAEKGDISGSIATIREGAAPALFAEYLILLDKIKMTPVYDVRLSPEVVQVLNSGLQELLMPDTALTPEKLAEMIEAAREGG